MGTRRFNQLVCAIALAAALTGASGAYAATNLVINGDFETGDLTGWNVLPSGTWNVHNSDILNSSAAFGLADLGYQGHISQNLDLVSGQAYHLSLDYAGGYNYGNSINIQIGDQSIGSILAYNYWYQRSSFDTYFTATGPSSLDINVNGYGTVFILDNVTVVSGAPPVAASLPTNAQLAAISQNARSDSAPGAVGGFVPIPDGSTGSRTDGVSIFAEAYVSRGENGGRDQVVIAIRGSKFGEDWVLRNGTFPSGQATQEFKNDVSEVAALIAKVHQDYHDADFTLTGHSMGGGVAEALGEATKIRTVGFDAPGANGVLDSTEQAALLDIAKSGVASPLYSSSNQITNIRYYGDVVSTVGDPYAQISTIIPSDATKFNEILNQNTILPGSCFLKCHDLSLILTELKAGTVPVTGIPDTSTAAIPIIFGAGGDGSGLKIFNNLFGDNKFHFFDPSGQGNYIKLDMLDSDISLGSVYLPGFGGEFEIFALGNDGWDSLGRISGFSEFSVPNAPSYLFSNASGLQDSDGKFLLGLKFSSEGTFRGALSVVTIGDSVPEPATWATMVLGFGFAGFKLRRSNIRRKKYGADF